MMFFHYWLWNFRDIRCLKSSLSSVFNTLFTLGVDVGFGVMSDFLSGFEKSPDRRSIEGLTREDILNFVII